MRGECIKIKIIGDKSENLACGSFGRGAFRGESDFCTFPAESELEENIVILKLTEEDVVSSDLLDDIEICGAIAAFEEPVKRSSKIDVLWYSVARLFFMHMNPQSDFFVSQIWSQWVIHTHGVVCTRPESLPCNVTVICPG